MESLENALAVVRGMGNGTRPWDETIYLQACEYLVVARGELTARVFIQLPGGLSGNNDAVWDRVKAGSVERCGCGNERTILPGNQRTEFKPSERTVTLGPGEKVALKSRGGDKASTHVLLEVSAEHGALTYMMDPYAPLVFNLSMLDSRGFSLEKLVEALQGRTTPLAVNTSTKIQLFAIETVDPKQPSVVIRLDEDIEVQDPDEPDAKPH